MPNSPKNDHKLDKMLSRLLNRSEPPRSPQHLDESILTHARQQAQVYRHAGKVGLAEHNEIDEYAENTETESAGSTGNTRGTNKPPLSHAPWYRQNWIPATVTFSIAAVAITVTLQNFGLMDFARDEAQLANQSENSFNEAFSEEQAEQDDTTAVADATVETRERRSSLSLPVSVATQQVDIETSRASDSISQQPGQDVVTDSLPGGADNAARDAIVEAAPATSTSVPPAVSAAGSPAGSNSDLAEVLKANSNDQTNLLALLESIIESQSAPNSIVAPRALNRSGSGLFDSLGLLATNPENLEERRDQLISQYGNLTDPEEFLNLASQYRRLRQALPSPTPETLEAAIELLELLNQ